MPDEGTPRVRGLAAGASHQRATGSVTLGLRDGPRGTAIATLEQRAPLRALFPTPDAGEALTIALLNCGGGLAGGDAAQVTLRLGAGAQALAATAAAEKVYRSLGPDAVVRTRLVLGPGAVLEWLPQETILFEGARLDRALHATLDAGARLLATEVLVFGRAARGERLASGRVRDAWRLDGPAGVLWRDALDLSGAVATRLDAPLGFAGAGAMGTVLLVGDGAGDGLAGLRALPGAAVGGATLLAGQGRGPDLLVGRWLGSAGAVRAAVTAAVVQLRAAALGRPARPPRLWTS